MAIELYKCGLEIKQIFSRNPVHAYDLAIKTGAEPVTEIEKVRSADIIIICVSDSAISEVARSLSVSDSLIVHTSGSSSINLLSHHKNYGVFYPFQTFSKSVDPDFKNVSVFIEANTLENSNRLVELALKISPNSYLLNSEQRMRLHLAAVFANNFVNHMYVIAKDILTETKLPMNVIYPLIEETTSRLLKSGNPLEMQTGPAVRGNHNILEIHKEILTEKPLWQKIYTFVSNSIMERVKEKKNGTF